MGFRRMQQIAVTPKRARRQTMSRVRTCVGCGERVQLSRESSSTLTLVRLVLGDGQVAVDGGAGGFGRGLHVHPRVTCVERAALRGIARAAKAKVGFVWQDEFSPGLSPAANSMLVALESSSLARAMVRSLERRALALFLSAVRARKIAWGADAVMAACAREKAPLVVVAKDATAAVELSVVRRAVADGRAVVWGSNGMFAASSSSSVSSNFGGEIEVIAMADDRIALAFGAAVRAASALSGLASTNAKRDPGKGRRVSDADLGDGVVGAAGESELSILERGA